MTSIAKVVATIRYISIYTCDDCGRHQNGTTAEVQLDTVSCIKSFIDNPPQRSHDMPVGWASHYGPTRDIFTCGCMRKD
jgi:hypothetical protein